MKKLLVLVCCCLVTPAFAQSKAPKAPAPTAAVVKAKAAPATTSAKVAPKPAPIDLFSIDSAPLAQPPANSALAKMLQGLHVRVCVRSDVPPFGQLSVRGLTGFDISLANKIVTRLSINYKRVLHIDWVVITAQDRIKRLQNNRCDLVVAAFSATPARAKLVGLSKAYAQTDKVLISATQITNKVPVIARLKGATGDFGGLKGAVKDFNSYQEIIYAMENGTVDHAVADRAIALHMIRSVNRRFKVSKVLAKDAEKYVVGVNKAHTHLLEAVNRALRFLANSGDLAHLSRQWL